MSWNDDIVGTALNIASTTHSPLRVMAGPGTGKTFAMRRRVARLLEEGTSPEKILAVTFTRVAAQDLVNELHNLGIEGCEKINAGTLHSTCFSILNQESVFSIIERNTRPLNYFIKSKVLKFEGSPLISDIRFNSDFGTSRDCTKRITAFEAAWARLQSEIAGWPVDPLDRAFHDKLIDWLYFHEAILIGELIPLTLDFLRNNPTSPFLNSFSHIIVDEYQDLNKAEQTLIDVLASGNSSIAIVGDSDQSIYSFRYAHPEGINLYHEDHDDTQDESLTYCRRCPKKVVQIADFLIRNNHQNNNQTRLNEFTDNPDGEINIVQWNNLEEEIVEISKYINHLTNNRYNPGDILVLSPRSKIGCNIRDKLLTQNIPAHSFYNEEILESEKTQEAFTILSLLINDSDKVSLRWFLGFGNNNWYARQYDLLKNYVLENNLSINEVLDGLQKNKITGLRIPNILNRYQILTDRLNQLRTLELSELVNTLFPKDDHDFSQLRKISLDYLENGNEVSDLYKSILTNITQPGIPTKQWTES